MRIDETHDCRRRLQSPICVVFTVTLESELPQQKLIRYRNVLYRYLGTKEGSTGTEPTQILPKEGDRYVLCSDGVTDGLKDDALQRLVQENDDPQQAAEAIVKAAEDGGSRDNITCVVLHVI